MSDPLNTFALRWRHPEGSPFFDGRWHDHVGGKGLSIFEALENLKWLKDNCPDLSKDFDNAIFREDRND